MQALQARNGAKGREELAQWILHRISDRDGRSELRFVRKAHPLTGSSAPATEAGPEPVSIHRMGRPEPNP